MSYRIKISPRARKTSRYVSAIVREVQRAFAYKQHQVGLTQQALAKKLGVDRSVVNRRLLGKDNMTMTTLAELAWALDHDLRVTFVDPALEPEANFWPSQDWSMHKPALGHQKEVRTTPVPEIQITS